MDILFLNRKLRSTRGFTIVELLVVIVVIGILSSITIVSYNGIQNRANNARRISDLATMARVIDTYYADNGVYPPSGSPNSATTCLSAASWNCWGAGTANRLVGTQYIATIPQDPQFNDGGTACNYPNNYVARMYGYITNADRSGYAVGAYLPGLSSSDPNYFNGGSNIGCMNFANYLIRKNI